jgi:mono/diheme cytochrome c family protein
MSCSQCHGDDAHGDEGPDLHNLSISNARIVVTIKKGIKGEMPTFTKKYDDHQIAALVAYLRSLR